MPRKDPSAAVRELSISIGDFIRYWGFRRIHGALWAQLFLSPKPLSCTELATRLKLSKALVSPALSELEKFRLIEPVESGNEKVKLYRAARDIAGVARHVLETREQKMLEKIEARFRSLPARTAEEIDPERVQELGAMIQAAKAMLELLLAQPSFFGMPGEEG